MKIRKNLINLHLKLSSSIKYSKEILFTLTFQQRKKATSKEEIFNVSAISLPVTWHFQGASSVFPSLKRLINKIKKENEWGLENKKNLSLIFPSAFLLLKFNEKLFCLFQLNKRSRSFQERKKGKLKFSRANLEKILRKRENFYSTVQK